MDDEGLLRQARHGDREAFASIVNRHQDELFTMALRLLGNPSDAADAVQETFLRAWQRTGELRGPTLRAWLFRVAINCSRDIQRRAVRRPTVALEADDGKIVDLPDPGLGPEASALARERTAAIATAVSNLPNDFRAALVLRDVSELSYEEVAAALAIPVGTAKSRVSRARTALAAALRQSQSWSIAEEHA